MKKTEVLNENNGKQYGLGSGRDPCRLSGALSPSVSIRPVSGGFLPFHSCTKTLRFSFLGRIISQWSTDHRWLQQLPYFLSVGCGREQSRIMPLLLTWAIIGVRIVTLLSWGNYKGRNQGTPQISDMGNRSSPLSPLSELDIFHSSLSLTTHDQKIIHL